MQCNLVVLLVQTDKVRDSQARCDMLKMRRQSLRLWKPFPVMRVSAVAFVGVALSQKLHVSQRIKDAFAAFHKHWIVVRIFVWMLNHERVGRGLPNTPYLRREYGTENHDPNHLGKTRLNLNQTMSKGSSNA